MAVAFVQEFTIQGGDRSTTNYDAVAARVGTDPPPGALAHTAGFDEQSGVFRIFDIWETQADAQRFIEGTLNPILQEVFAGRQDVQPPAREYFYELHDFLKA
jgi:hypothetical protein